MDGSLRNRYLVISFSLHLDALKSLNANIFFKVLSESNGSVHAGDSGFDRLFCGPRTCHLNMSGSLIGREPTGLECDSGCVWLSWVMTLA